MAIYFTDEAHEERFRSLHPRVQGDVWREPVLYIMASNRMLWLSVQEGEGFKHPKVGSWKPTFKTPNGSKVTLNSSEETLGRLAWALFSGGAFEMGRLRDLDGVEWRVALEALRIWRVGVQRLETAGA